MTRTELADLVEKWRAQIIPEWRVILMKEPPSDEEEDSYYAISQCKDDYTEICIHFPDSSLKRSRDEIEVTVIHELLHAVTRPWRSQVNKMARELPSATAQMLYAERSHEEEQAVDRLSRILAGGNAFETKSWPE